MPETSDSLAPNGDAASKDIISHSTDIVNIKHENNSKNVVYSLSAETDGVVETANGDPVAVDEGNVSTKCSLSTYEEEGREKLAKYLKNKT